MAALDAAALQGAGGLTASTRQRIPLSLLLGVPAVLGVVLALTLALIAGPLIRVQHFAHTSVY